MQGIVRNSPQAITTGNLPRIEQKEGPGRRSHWWKNFPLLNRVGVIRDGLICYDGRTAERRKHRSCVRAGIKMLHRDGQHRSRVLHSARRYGGCVLHPDKNEEIRRSAPRQSDAREREPVPKEFIPPQRPRGRYAAIRKKRPEKMHGAKFDLLECATYFSQL